MELDRKYCLTINILFIVLYKIYTWYMQKKFFKLKLFTIFFIFSRMFFYLMLKDRWKTNKCWYKLYTIYETLNLFKDYLESILFHLFIQL